MISTANGYQESRQAAVVAEGRPRQRDAQATRLRWHCRRRQQRDDDNDSSHAHRKQVKHAAARHRGRFPFQVNSASVGEQGSRDGRMLHLPEGGRSQFTVYPHLLHLSPPSSPLRSSSFNRASRFAARATYVHGRDKPIAKVTGEQQNVFSNCRWIHSRPISGETDRLKLFST